MAKNSDLSGGAIALGVVVALAVFLLVGAWTTMIGFGILAAHAGVGIPAISFSHAFWVNIGVGLIIGGRSTYSSRQAK